MLETETSFGNRMLKPCGKRRQVKVAQNEAKHHISRNVGSPEVL